MTTGEPLLDRMLDGGYPRERSILLVGGPGTGKSTLAMQFLQAGLDAGESCLYVSTEQSGAELRDSFESFAFDLEDPNLTISTLHASLGKDALELTTLDDEWLPGEAFGLAFRPDAIAGQLERFAPCDRIVFDSASALDGVVADADRDRRAQRTLLDLVRLFTDEFGATTLFTAEGEREGKTDGSDYRSSPLRFTTHGVVQLYRDTVAEDYHRYLNIVKMRGTDHDPRPVELEFCDDGVRLGPERRSQPPELKRHRHLPLGVDGLDELIGGGPVVGTGVLLQHDGRADIGPLVGAFATTALDEDRSALIGPAVDLGPDRFASLLAGHGYDLWRLMEDERLFVLDAVGAWDDSLATVYDAGNDIATAKRRIEEIDSHVAGGDRWSLFDVDSFLHQFGPDGVRELRYFQESTLLDDGDILAHIHNVAGTREGMEAFHVGAAGQVLRTWLTDAGLQYLTLAKSPCGFVGSTSLVEYMTDPPYVRVASPPQDRETAADLATE